MNLRSYLHELRKADHLIASLPKGPVRSKFQVYISQELDRLLKLQQVESTKKSTNEKVTPHHRVFCAVDAETPPDPWGG
ncbi:MAG: hypothetical protein OEV42_11745 [Deltaproteobacteria bacterium]|nr:hypothetical protein [Deltaproteobacteria bacterium]